jgi:uncharacterized ferritin-like protein (DUF455 family)
MKLSQYCQTILKGETLEHKLLDVDKIEFDEFDLFDVPKLPERENSIRFSGKNLKFPRGHFHEIEKKAIALHSFANHELLAIEMMACALAIYPHNTDELRRFKLGVISSLKDEQKHFKLYRKRLNEIGYEFGDFDLNDFFWKYMDKLETPSHYLSVMGLTFEAANLDFAHFYQHVFQELGDNQTASVLKIVLDDEISHVQLGVNYLNKWRDDKDLWTYYQEHLPYPLTPARSKGKIFVEHVRQKAKMDQEFIDKVKNYSDGFGITNRKEWKK